MAILRSSCHVDLGLTLARHAPCCDCRVLARMTGKPELSSTHCQLLVGRQSARDSGVPPNELSKITWEHVSFLSVGIHIGGLADEFTEELVHGTERLLVLNAVGGTEISHVLVPHPDPVALVLPD